MRRRNDFIIKAAIVAVAIFSVVMLLAFRIKISQLEDQKSSIEAEMSLYKQKIDELEGELGLSDSDFLNRVDEVEE